METVLSNSAFPPTRWTAVIAVQKRGDTTSTSKALAELCEIYWYPLYSFARRLGYNPHDCQDLTQGFFCYVVDKDLFSTADRDLGKLRTFLLTTFRRYLSGVRDHDKATKRGGQAQVVSLDLEVGEKRYADEPVDSTTPENLFERNWAYSVLRSALEALAEAEKKAGRGPQYDILAPFLSPEFEVCDSYEVVGARLGVSEAGARQAVSRLRRKFRDLLRAQIADTLRDPTGEQVNEELIALREALQG
ncbi:MAG TPA: sigma-70 family RNA polymerase sigma factor [Chthoniobacteraceae bacterium]